MNLNILTILILSCLFASCNDGHQAKAKGETTLEFQNKGHELVYAMVQKVGNYAELLDKRDVSYTYTYQTPDGKTDLS